MHTIRVITKKLVKKKIPKHILGDYSNLLKHQVIKQDGFIKSNSYWHDLEEYSPAQIITISKWDNYESWNNWLESKSRYDVSKHYSSFIEMEEHKVLCRNIKKFDMFLL